MTSSFKKSIPTSFKNNLNRASTLFQQGLALHQQGQIQKATALYQQVLHIHPHHFDAHNNLCCALYQQKHLDEALEGINRLISLHPESAEAFHNRGAILHDLKRYTEAVESYDHAIALNPNHAKAYSNRCYSLFELERFEEAVQSGLQAITLAPHSVEAHFNLGVVYHALEAYELSQAHYLQSLKLNPDSAKAHWNLSLQLLLLGIFDGGWEEYEWRWKNEELELYGTLRHFNQPLWLGHEPLAGKTILLHAEQGFGDTLQFCRYAILVAHMGARVILEVQDPLRPLLHQLDGIACCISRGAPLPPFDFHCPLMSLPLAFKTTLVTIPAAPRYLSSDSVILEAWQARLGRSSKPRIGITWQGYLKHPNDLKRSIPLQSLLDIIPTDQFQCISLQKDLLPQDRKILEEHPEILHFEESINDFSDTAALCELMDLIITIDTSGAHLAGSLGKLVWLLLPKIPDWRWMLARTDTPWYPNTALYRQSVRGNWEPVLHRVSVDLMNHDFVSND